MKIDVFLTDVIYDTPEIFVDFGGGTSPLASVQINFKLLNVNTASPKASEMLQLPYTLSHAGRRADFSIPHTKDIKLVLYRIDDDEKHGNSRVSCFIGNVPDSMLAFGTKTMRTRVFPTN